MTFDYYWRSSNAVVSQDIAYEYGVSTMKLNGGKIQNSGVEFTVSFTPIQRKDWALSVSLNSSKNWNEAKSQQYAAKRGEMLAGSSEKILKKGYPLSGFWSYSFAGLSPEDGRPLFNYLDVPEEELMVRLIKRGKDSGRADDNEETIKKRLHVYHSQTAPLIDWYKNEKKYQHINGLGTMEGIFAEICEAVDKL